jgi:putative nucleotidyltransferase with HDIG domain
MFGDALLKIKGGIIFRNFLRRFGIVKATLIATLLAIFSSLVLYFCIATVLGQITPIGIFSSFVIPTCVTPPIAYSILRLAQRLGLAERELLDAYNSLELQVRMRTAELITANRQLQEEIVSRSRTEQKLKKGIVRMKKNLEKTISAIAAVSEIRDPFTAGHQRRVTTLVCAIAEEMALPDEQCESLRLASIVHDIGKINIPTEILVKPTRLSEPEFNIIEAHPQIGHDILQGIEFSQPVAKIVLQHHELMDGTGYPQGLSGNEIMLEARILAVADVIEAMASHRPYRPAQGIGMALEEILHNRGELYDADVVDACLRVFYEKNFMFE